MREAGGLLLRLAHVLGGEVRVAILGSSAAPTMKCSGSPANSGRSERLFDEIARDEPRNQHRRKAADHAGHHLCSRPNGGGNRGHDMRAPAVDHPAARQYHQHISP
jgi:hypothetical protein